MRAWMSMTVALAGVMLMAASGTAQAAKPRLWVTEWRTTNPLAVGNQIESVQQVRVEGNVVCLAAETGTLASNGKPTDTINLTSSGGGCYSGYGMSGEVKEIRLGVSPSQVTYVEMKGDFVLLLPGWCVYEFTHGQQDLTAPSAGDYLQPAVAFSGKLDARLTRGTGCATSENAVVEELFSTAWGYQTVL